ncbi:hypothetical protein [Pseudomonas sp. NA-150]|uniref:hypothetical protein n=1 Tax=Pseudomonas sp. NA-150 TaxID=3367525 RepID=UPI0037C79D58
MADEISIPLKFPFQSAGGSQIESLPINVDTLGDDTAGEFDHKGKIDRSEEIYLFCTGSNNLLY